MEKNSVVEYRISIIIPVYNAPVNYLTDCLNSIKKIKIPVNVIIVNDGSTSQVTNDFLETTKSQYTIVNKKDGGLSSARNAGVREAIESTGLENHFIYTLDQDDTLNAKYFEEAVQFLNNHPEVDILYSDRQNFGDKTNYVKTREFNKAYLFFVGNITFAMIFFKQKITGYDETLPTIEDYDFVVRAAANNFNFRYFPKPIFNYRIIFDGKSLSQASSGKFLDLKKKIRSQVTLDKISKEDIHGYILSSFKHNKFNFFKLALSLISENTVDKLVKMKIFKSKYPID